MKYKLKSKTVDVVMFNDLQQKDEVTKQLRELGCSVKDEPTYSGAGVSIDFTKQYRKVNGNVITYYGSLFTNSIYIFDGDGKPTHISRSDFENLYEPVENHKPLLDSNDEPTN